MASPGPSGALRVEVGGAWVEFHPGEPGNPASVNSCSKATDSRNPAKKTAAAQVEAAKGQYDSAQAQVSYSEIRSPINGVVTDRPLYPGEIANPGTPVMTIMVRSK